MGNLTVIQAIASLVEARATCIQTGNREWQDKHEERIRTIARNQLPHGNGLDIGCTVDLKRSRPDRIVIDTGFHHMNDAGFYDGWTDHTLTVWPAFFSVGLKISGRDRNQIKDYLRDLFLVALQQEVAP